MVYSVHLYVRIYKTLIKICLSWRCVVVSVSVRERSKGYTAKYFFLTSRKNPFHPSIPCCYLFTQGVRLSSMETNVLLWPFLHVAVLVCLFVFLHPFIQGLEWFNDWFSSLPTAFNTTGHVGKDHIMHQHLCCIQRKTELWVKQRSKRVI